MYWWFLLGLITGLRTLTPLAVFSVFAAMGAFPALAHTWAFWLANPIAAGVFTLLAIGEYVGDVLPKTPSRREWGPAISRVVSASLVGAAASTAMVLTPWGGALFAAVGAVLGTTGGWWVRMTLSRKLGRDWPIGVLESTFALAAAVAICKFMAKNATFWNGVEHRITASLPHVGRLLG